MKRILLVLTIVLTAGSGIANSANWVYLTSSEDGNLFFDKDSVFLSENDLAKVWTKTDCIKKEGCRIPNGKHVTAKTLFRINCRESKLGAEITTFYDDKDLVVQDVYLPIPVMKQAGPDTPNEALVKSVCPQRQ